MYVRFNLVSQMISCVIKMSFRLPNVTEVRQDRVEEKHRPRMSLDDVVLFADKL